MINSHLNIIGLYTSLYYLAFILPRPLYFPGLYTSPAFILPRPLYFPGLYTSLVFILLGLYTSSAFILPRPLYFPGLYTSPAFILPRPLYFPGLYISLVFILLRTLYFPGLYTSSAFILPWSLYFLGLYTSLVFILLRTLYFLGLYTSPAFAGLSGIRAGWGIEINGRFEAERLPVSAGPPSAGRAATVTPLSPMYSTRPCCLVQAITWHPCPNPD